MRAVVLDTTILRTPAERVEALRVLVARVAPHVGVSVAAAVLHDGGRPLAERAHAGEVLGGFLAAAGGSAGRGSGTGGVVVAGTADGDQDGPTPAARAAAQLRVAATDPDPRLRRAARLVLAARPATPSPWRAMA